MVREVLDSNSTGAEEEMTIPVVNHDSGNEVILLDDTLPDLLGRSSDIVDLTCDDNVVMPTRINEPHNQSRSLPHASLKRSRRGTRIAGNVVCTINNCTSCCCPTTGGTLVVVHCWHYR